MNENLIILVTLLVMIAVGGLFIRQNYIEHLEERSPSIELSQKDKRSLVDSQSESPKRLISCTQYLPRVFACTCITPAPPRGTI